jgi:1-piperideine-2-carboxylate/1-pyrroline-2-carboxylate reductase [NAD(P)H]
MDRTTADTDLSRAAEHGRRPAVLDAAATQAALPFAALLDALRRAALELEAGTIACPPRLAVPLPDGGVMLAMPAVAADVAAHKLVTVAPGNAARGLPVVQGVVTALDATSGEPRLLLDGPALTGRRTAAVSMLALAAAGHVPRRVCLVGTGAQARAHIHALAALHPVAQVELTGRRPDAVAALCRHGAALGLRVAPAAAGLADGVDTVVLCTSSAEPVYAEAARAGRAVVAVGAFQPHAAEVAAATVQASRAVVDDPTGARHEAGDLIRAGVDWDSVLSLAQLLRAGPAALGGAPLFFKSVGSAAWDLAATRVALASSAGRATVGPGRAA